MKGLLFAMVLLPMVLLFARWTFSGFSDTFTRYLEQLKVHAGPGDDINVHALPRIESARSTRKWTHSRDEFEHYLEMCGSPQLVAKIPLIEQQIIARMDRFVNERTIAKISIPYPEPMKDAQMKGGERIGLAIFISKDKNDVYSLRFQKHCFPLPLPTGVKWKKHAMFKDMRLVSATFNFWNV